MEINNLSLVIEDPNGLKQIAFYYNNDGDFVSASVDVYPYLYPITVKGLINLNPFRIDSEGYEIIAYSLSNTLPNGQKRYFAILFQRDRNGIMQVLFPLPLEHSYSLLTRFHCERLQFLNLPNNEGQLKSEDQISKVKFAMNYNTYKKQNIDDVFIGANIHQEIVTLDEQ